MKKDYNYHNYKFWQRGYRGKAPNIESSIFRLQGQILKPILKLPRKNHNVNLDFGCGQGATVNYFNNQGYESYGIDISKKDIQVAKKNFPRIKNRFTVCDSNIFNSDLTQFTNNKKIDLISCQQSLYYFDKIEFNLLLENFINSLKPKGILYASMISDKHTYKKFSKKIKNSWLSEVNWKNHRVNIKKYYINFIKDYLDMKRKFNSLKILFLGSYEIQLSDKESNGHHYTIVAQKK